MPAPFLQVPFLQVKAWEGNNLSSDRTMELSLIQGLTALVALSFPKRCRNCGQLYATLEDFIAGTSPCGHQSSGLKEGEAADGGVVVEVFRNCVCGSTLMEFCGNRRQQSEEAINRRKKFDQMLSTLEGKGVEREVARSELRKVMRGQESKLLGHYLKV